MNQNKPDPRNAKKPAARKPAVSKPITSRQAEVARTPGPQAGRSAPARGTAERTLPLRPSQPPAAGLTPRPTALPPTAPTPSAYSNGSWFDDGGRPGGKYSALYSRLDKETFSGYACLEGDLARNYRVPIESIERIRMLKGCGMPTYPVFDQRGNDRLIPMADVNSAEHRNNTITVGVAIQQIYMSLLREQNAIFGQWMTPFSTGPSRDWTLYIGDMIDSMNVPLLKEHDIGFVMSIHPIDFRSRGQRGLLRDARIKHHICQLDDSPNADMLKHLNGLIGMINEHTSSATKGQGKSVLVHCNAGLSRSVAVALAWSQGEFYERRLKNAPGTPQEKYKSLIAYRKRKFEDLKSTRLRVKCDNFEFQLECHAASLTGSGVPPPPPGGKAGKEHGGGGYLKEAVAWFFYIYHLRPSRTVLNFAHERLKKQHCGQMMWEHIKPWCDACEKKLQYGTAQRR